MPKLIVTLQDGTQQTYDLAEESITIGRSPDNTLQIEDPSVSSHHASLVFKDDDYVLRDVGSTNGSRLNGKDLATDTDYRLQDGDTLRLGKVEGSYESENKTGARPMPTEDTPELLPAESSSAPVNFQNASPFQSKKKKKDPIGMAVIALAILAILGFAAVLMKVLAVQAPL
ncbi:MAG: FHA domain-containing protein [Chthoniobacteraceae bacterium]